MNKGKVFRRKLSTLGIVCIILAVGVTGAILYYSFAGRSTAQNHDTSNVDFMDDPSSYALSEPFYQMPHNYDWDLHWLGGSNVVPMHHP